MKHRQAALVSGGSRGLGLAIVEHLLRQGLAVATFSRKESETARRLASEWGEQFHFQACDIADPEAVASLVEKVEADFGPIEYLVNNAGIAHDGVLATFPEEELERVIATNLKGTLHLTRQCVRRMLLRRRGRIVSISSIIGQRGYSGLAVYSATKAGIDGMTRSLARELGSANILVNSVAPGYLETEMSGTLDASQKEQIARRTPLGRLGTPEDVAGVVAFLLSDAAGFITGQTITIDGGIGC